MKNPTPTPEKKEKKIDIRDFEMTPLQYLSYKSGDVEIAIEPCLNGADVAVYKNMELLEPKRCTNIKGFTTAEDYLGFSKTVMGWANEYKEKYIDAVNKLQEKKWKVSLPNNLKPNPKNE